MNKKITIDFSSTKGFPTWTGPRRQYGGIGIHDKVEPLDANSTFHIEGRRGGRLRRFLAIHRPSSTGSGLGSFRIDEVVENGKTVTHGYHCSYPDFDACVLVAQENTH